MKIFYNIAIRIITLFLFLIIAFVISFVFLSVIFILLKYTTPAIINIKVRNFQIYTATLLAIIFAYLFISFIAKPVNNMLKWLKLLSEGDYKVENKVELLKFKNSVVLNKWSYFLYKELISQMKNLTERLLEAEKQRKLLEENRRQWIAGITHDLKTPLSYVRGYSSMITAPNYQWNSEDIKTFTKKIEEKAIHMETLINDLSTSLKFYDGELLLKKSPTNMNSFVQKLVIDLVNNPIAKDYSFSLESKLEEDILIIDAQLISRSLQNIIMNAVLHNPIDTKIQVSLDKIDNYFQIQIKDDGKGMDEETLNNMFEKYYRGTPTDSHPEGSGLGMALAKQFVEAHNGLIEVESKINYGTCVTIKIPA
ncbi:HAMP domain-containing histidine kinase [Clostridium beijerinckii]|uniref:sensor histidine kinase n=1 Tax=Clostridium beijerinckii TaxID=1520 RepID=UPI001494CF76|nr:HAMP domain-containing sensor histidine kinase [Clostridium beijerinckii]NOW05534.1 signal transduction histidine kinase [Clostridium beijerinckii]NYC01322.1 signal transduction histidine kinase [Clostridium beijerinckii]UYZ33772.1 HAMP domain-containing histidine kinase [Clostridium beijerinckii]